MRWAGRITGTSRRRWRLAVRTGIPTCRALPLRGMGCFVPVLMGERAWPSLCSCRCSRVTLPADGRLTRQRDIGRSSRSRSLASTFEFLPPPARAKDVPLAGRSDTGSRRSYTRVESGDMGRVCRVATTESPELARRGLGCSSFGSCASLPAPQRLGGLRRGAPAVRRPGWRSR